MFLALAALMAYPAEISLGVQSAILPGMGQVAAGEGKITSLNTVKGLGIMAGFVFSLNGLVNAMSAYDSYAEETRTLEQDYQNAAYKSDKDRLYERWDAAYENSQDAKIALVVFSLLTAAVYGYGVTDALLFTKVKEKKLQGQTSERAVRPRLQLSRRSDRQGLEVMVRF
jgi:hypothetical protein